MGLVVGSVALVYACAESAAPPGSRSSGGRAGAGGSPAAGENQGGESAAGQGSGGRAGATGETGGSAGKSAAGGSSGGGRGGRDGGRGGASGKSGALGGEGGELSGAGGEAPEPVNVPGVRSGTRLRPRVWSGSDGSRHVISLHDTLLGIDCDFANLGAAGYRCVPLEQNGTYNGVFADDQCEDAAVGYEPGCGPSAFHVTSTAPSTCDGMPHRAVYEVGASIPGAYYDSPCKPYPVGDDDADWYATTPADPQDFVEGSLEHVFLGGGLSVVVVASSDGARHARTLWFDDRPCSAIELTGAGYHCAPAPRLNRYTYFADDECTTGLGFTQPLLPACGTPPHLAVSRPNQESCGSSTSVVEVTPFESSTAYRVDANACVGLTLPPTPLVRYTIGSEVEPGVLPKLSLIPSGNTRLQREVVRTPNRSTVELSSAIFDAELGVTCTPQPFDDGIVRCTPDAGGVSGYFADAACSVPVSSVGPCDTTEYFIEFAPIAACSVQAVTSVYRKGAAHTGAVHRMEESDCVEVEDPGIDDFFVLAPVSRDELVTLTSTVE